MDQDRIIVGSHSGVSVFDVHTGARIERTYDENYKRTRDDDGHIYVLPVEARLDLFGELTCDWRDGDLW